MADENIPRRRFLQGAGAVATALGTTLNAEAQSVLPTERTAAAQLGNEPLLTLTATEAAFLSAAYDTIVPADALSPSGTDCGLVNYIDRQLAGAWGNGSRLYRSGPFVPGKPEQGYQLSLTPREFFAAGIKAANEWSRMTYGKEFDRLAPADRDAALKTMDAGKAAVRGHQRQAVLRGAAAIGDGGLLRRSDLWRQSRQGLLADDRLSRPAGSVCRQGAGIPRQEGR